MNRGPQQQRLRDYLDPANQATLRTAAAQWRQGQDLLKDIGGQLVSMAGSIATSADSEFQGEAANATRTSFHTSAQAMATKSEQMGQGAQAFDDSANAIAVAVSERDSLAQNDGDELPSRPTSPAGSTEPEDVRAQRSYDTAVAAYWDRYQADEQRASDAMTRLDEKHTAAGEVFKSIHGEPDPEPTRAPGGGTTPAGGGGTNPAGTSTQGPGTSTLTSTTQPHPVYDNDGRPLTDGGTVDEPTPPTGGGDDATPGDPEGPSGPGTSTSTGVPGSPTTNGTGPSAGGIGTPTTGGAVAAGVGVGVVGGLTGGVAGGLAFPGAVTGSGSAAGGGRGIGGAGTRGVGSSVLGRGNGVVGIGNGAGTSARGSGRGAGRVGAGGTGVGRGQGRGAPGSRGALTGGGGSGRGDRDKRRAGAEHELFDDGTDWLDDEGAYDGVID